MFVFNYMLLQGTGRNEKSISDLLKSLRLVNGKGEFSRLPEDARNTSMKEYALSAARVNLGLFGVAVEYTLEVQPMSTSRVLNLFGKRMNVSS